MLEKFEALLDEKVRPSLQAHGGDVVIRSYENNVLKVKLIGKCSGCPSAHDTNEELIAAEVIEAFPEVKDVEKCRDNRIYPDSKQKICIDLQNNHTIAPIIISSGFPYMSLLRLLLHRNTHRPS